MDDRPPFGNCPEPRSFAHIVGTRSRWRSVTLHNAALPAPPAYVTPVRYDVPMPWRAPPTCSDR